MLRLGFLGFRPGFAGKISRSIISFPPSPLPANRAFVVSAEARSLVQKTAALVSYTMPTALSECIKEESYDLCASTGLANAEFVGGDTTGDTVFKRPKHCLIVVFVRLYIRKGAGCHAWFRAPHSLPKEGHRLLAGTALTDAKFSTTYTTSNAIFHSPHHCIVVVFSGLHVTEGVAGHVMARLPASRIEEGYDLFPGAGALGVELAVAGAGGDTICHGPCDSVEVVCRLLHI